MLFYKWIATVFCFFLFNLSFINIFHLNFIEAAERESTIKGTIRISGAWALYPMMIRWGEEFRKVNPQLRLDISAGGAGKGVADVLANLTDIGMVSRNITNEEIKNGAFYLPVVKDAVFPTMNSNNVLSSVILKKGLKKQQLIDLWINGKILTWGEFGGNHSKKRVQVYTRSDSCGAAETWANYLGGKKQEDLKGVGVYGDPGLADAVKKDISGVGFNNLNYAFDSKSGQPISGIMIIPIDVNENGKIDPKEDVGTKQKAIKAVITGAYPSPPARDLYLVARGKFKGPAKEFVKWVMTEGQKYVEEAGYIRLPATQIKKGLKTLEN